MDRHGRCRPSAPDWSLAAVGIRISAAARASVSQGPSIAASVAARSHRCAAPRHFAPASGGSATSTMPSTTLVLIRRKRYRRRPAEHRAGAHVERCPMQGTSQPRALEITLAHAREGMGTDIVDGEHAVPGMAHHELALPDAAGAHAATSDFGECENGLEKRVQSSQHLYHGAPAARRDAHESETTIDTGPPDAKSDTLGGVIMLSAAALALVWANSPWAAAYQRSSTCHARSFSLGVNKSLGLLDQRRADGHFFLYVGLEIKREIVEEPALQPRPHRAAGHRGAGRNDRARRCSFSPSTTTTRWPRAAGPFPCATDIAFSLAVLRVVGNRVPISLRVFLTAVAILDDIGAHRDHRVLLHRAAYPMTMLLLALIPIAGLIALNRARVASTAFPTRCSASCSGTAC